jgi:mono/diheme cytochrome c family protein
LARGARLAVGIALFCAALGAAAFALAWHPEIEKIDPPVASSFDRMLVAQGEDLARIGNCTGCHTVQPSRLLAGGRPLSTPFGEVFATNITPHPEDGIGAWSRAAFVRAMRRGIARNGEHLYPAFPYEHFTHATDSELEALYAWLMTRKPIAGRAPETQLSGLFGFRPVLAGWNLLYLREGPLPADLSQSADWNRGRSLVEGLAHCGGCHTPRDRLGAEDRSRAYDGHWVQGWYAPPINARSPAVRPWTVDELHVYLRTGLGPMHAAAAGPMANVTRGLAQVPDEDVRAIAVYTASLMADAPAAKQDRAEPVDRLAEAQRAHPEAATLFAGACAVCHEPGAPMMQEGRPHLAWGTPLHADNAHGTVRIIMKGVTAPPGAAGPTMPAFVDMLDDRQIREIAAYLRARFTDKPPWSDTGDAVAEARKGEGDRPGDRK